MSKSVFAAMLGILMIFATELCLASSETLKQTDVDPKIEKKFIDEVKHFLDEEINIINRLKTFKSHIVETRNKVFREDPKLVNQLNELSVVKRIVFDWHFISALATLHKYEFLTKLKEDVSIIQKHPSFPTTGNLRNSVLEIAAIQEKGGINSLEGFMMALTNKPFAKITASDCSLISNILREVNKHHLAEVWDRKSRSLQAMSKDPLMDFQTAY